ncbi:MAG TPA: BadF/BadG/BcrA/BcrD ATPase family protein [Chloroflexia bacterium]
MSRRKMSPVEAIEYVLGVDGGNTKTIALVARLDGTIVGYGRGGCSDIYTNPDPAVPLSEAEKAIRGALEMAGLETETLVVGAFSMAGADWPEDFTLIDSAMRAWGFGRRVIVVNDAVGALWAGALSGPAVVVACGTGAATASRSEDGRVWHSSWWQDPQGAHHMGMKTLQAVYRAQLGIDPPTLLTESVLRHFEQESVEGVLHLFMSRVEERPPSARVSQLSRVLLDAVEAGDLTARRIVEEHAEALGDYALAAARQVGIEGSPFTLALTGGVFRHSCSLLAEALIARVRASSAGVVPVYSRFEPAVGALLLGLEAEDCSLEEPLLARLTASLPDVSLFAT